MSQVDGTLEIEYHFRTGSGMKLDLIEILPISKFILHLAVVHSTNNHCRLTCIPKFSKFTLTVSDTSNLIFSFFVIKCIPLTRALGLFHNIFTKNGANQFKYTSIGLPQLGQYLCSIYV